MGRALKSQYIEIQNPKKSSFNNIDGVKKICSTWKGTYNRG